MVFYYQKSSGQVLGSSEDAQVYAGVDPTVYGVLTDPSIVGKFDTLVMPIWDGATIREATAQETAAYPTAQSTDAVLVARKLAIARLQSDPALGKLLRAIVAELAAQTTKDVVGITASIVNRIATGSVD